MDPVYIAGETVELHTDLFPAFITPTPSGVPGHGVKKRIIVTERCLTIGWSVGGRVQRLDIPMTKAQTERATLRGGTVGQFQIGLDQGCGSCGSGAIKSWKPWPGIVTRTVPRAELAKQEISRDKTYGLPSARYSRSR